MSKLTAAQAFDHIKALWPKTSRIEKDSHYGWRAFDAKNQSVAGGSSGIELDWGTQTEYPVPPKVTYRDATVDDLKTMPQAEFSDLPEFENFTTGKLVGYSVIDKVARWYCGFPNGAALSYRYCRIPVKLPVIPEGWEIITDEHRKRWTVWAAGYADIYTTDGKILKRCFYAADHPGKYRWRQFGVDWIDNPKYVREHRT